MKIREIQSSVPSSPCKTESRPNPNPNPNPDPIMSLQSHVVMMQNRYISWLNCVLHVILFHSIKFEIWKQALKQFTMPSTIMHVRNAEIPFLHGEIVFRKYSQTETHITSYTKSIITILHIKR